MRALRSMALRLALPLCLALGQAESGGAATFTVNPVQVYLSAKTRSVILTLRNVSDGTLRFQLDAHAWDQDERGEMALQPTRDIVFFPALVTLAPGEERNIRVGTATPQAANEKTYRIFVEELPPPAGTILPPGQVRVLTKVGIPIFIEAIKASAAARVDDARLRAGAVSFAVRNTGTVHFVVQSVRLVGFGPAGERIVEGAEEGWYVLPGGVRRYEMTLPAADCARIRSLAIEVQTSRTTLNERVDAPAGACAP